MASRKLFFPILYMVTIFEPISNIVLWVKETDLVNFNDSAVFMCSVSEGTSWNYEWLNSNSNTSAGEEIQLMSENVTLSILGVSQNDTGVYRCNVSSDLGHEVSLSIQLNVSYGPKNITAIVIFEEFMYKTASNETLHCSKESNTSATVHWMFDEKDLNQHDGELQLDNATLNNSQNYKCVFHNITLGFNSTNTTMQNMDPVSAVFINQVSGSPILNQSFSLQCDVPDSVNKIQWFKNDQLISTYNTTNFGNNTLTFNQVQLSDNGNYLCQAFNLVSNKTSSPYELTVNHGPESVTVIGPDVVKTGNIVSLKCEAISSPPSNYKWFFNESLIGNTSEYTTPPLSKEWSGKYTCMASNNVTNKNSTANIVISVVDPVSAVFINQFSGPPILNQSFSLQCDVPDSVNKIQWFKDDQLISTYNTTKFGNNTLTFNQVQLSDNGNYLCRAFNLVSNKTSSPYELTVNYGPDMVTMIGPNVVKTGETVTLKCEAISSPPSNYKWFFNESLIGNTSEYTTAPLSKEWSGNYTCMASNNVTNKNSTAYIMISVVDPIEHLEIEAQIDPAIEGQSYKMTCNVSGHADYIYWKKDSKILHSSDNAVFEMDNTTITFMPVGRSDAGDYQCVAGNALGEMSSASYLLTVNYGPDRVTISAPNVMKTGNADTLTCEAASVPPSNYEWFFNYSLLSNTSVYTTPPLTREKSGEYTCQVFNPVTNIKGAAHVLIAVVDPIEYVRIDGQMDPAIEGQTYKMICNITGPTDNVYWKKNQQVLSVDNIRLFSINNTAIIFKPLDRSDIGSYQCVAKNALGEMTSASHMLNVKFEPEIAIIEGPAYAETESLISFNCTVFSGPAGYFSWWYKSNSTEGQTRQNLLMENSISNKSQVNFGPLSLNMSGEITCNVYNPVTRRNTTNSTFLTVIEAIHSVTINTNSTALDGKNFTLTCQVVGPYEMIFWMKDGMLFSTCDCNPVSDLCCHTEMNMQHFTPLTLSSRGLYQCVAVNKAAHHKSPTYDLLVIYGPLQVNISGPDSDKEGVFVSFTCLAVSWPECDYQWLLKNDSKVYGSVITFEATKDNEGSFTCMATNSITDITMSANKSFTVSDHASAIHVHTPKGLLIMGLLAFLVHVIIHSFTP